VPAPEPLPPLLELPPLPELPLLASAPPLLLLDPPAPLEAPPLELPPLEPLPLELELPDALPSDPPATPAEDGPVVPHPKPRRQDQTAKQIERPNMHVKVTNASWPGSGIVHIARRVPAMKTSGWRGDYRRLLTPLIQREMWNLCSRNQSIPSIS
jgi:hypothetical protein